MQSNKNQTIEENVKEIRTIIEDKYIRKDIYDIQLENLEEKIKDIEEKLLNAINEYLKNIISNKKNFMKVVEKEFEKITKLRESSERSEESLLKEIEKVTTKKHKKFHIFKILWYNINVKQN